MFRTTLTPAVLLLFAVAPAVAQPAQSLARIRVTVANLYSGPGEPMPKCGSLEQGALVIVDHPEGNDWLAVQAPVASLSWISHLNVQLQNAGEAEKPTVTQVLNAVVRNEGGVKIAAGQVGSDKPLNVRRTNIPEGTIVKIIGPKVRATATGDTAESSWYPILPPRDDFRYVRRADVELIGGTEKPGFVVKAAAHVTPPGEKPVATLPPAGSRPTLSGGEGSNNPFWKDAEKARQETDFTRAERLYKQAAEEATTGGDTALANLCFSRIHSIRELQRQKERGDAPVLKPLTLDVPAVAQKSAPSAPATVSGSGELRVVDFKYENRQVYALTDKRGVSLYLVSDLLDLKRYNRRMVELSGSVSYPKEFAGTGLLRVSSVDKVEGK